MGITVHSLRGTLHGPQPILPSALSGGDSPRPVYLQGRLWLPLAPVLQGPRGGEGTWAGGQGWAQFWEARGRRGLGLSGTWLLRGPTLGPRAPTCPKWEVPAEPETPDGSLV